MKSSLFIEKVLGNAERNWWASKATKFIKPSSYDKKEISTQKLGTSHFVLNSSGKIYEHNSIPKHVFTKYRSSKKKSKVWSIFLPLQWSTHSPTNISIIQNSTDRNSKFEISQNTIDWKTENLILNFNLLHLLSILQHSTTMPREDDLANCSKSYIIR